MSFCNSLISRSILLLNSRFILCRAWKRKQDGECKVRRFIWRKYSYPGHFFACVHFILYFYIYIERYSSHLACRFEYASWLTNMDFVAFTWVFPSTTYAPMYNLFLKKKVNQFQRTTFYALLQSTSSAYCLVNYIPYKIPSQMDTERTLEIHKSARCERPNRRRTPVNVHAFWFWTYAAFDLLLEGTH